jgi:hypothetical protein
MGDAHFVGETIQALNSHAAELDSMYRGVMTATENRTEIPNVKDIFKEMAEASGNAMRCSKYIMETKIHCYLTCAGQFNEYRMDCPTVRARSLHTWPLHG